MKKSAFTLVELMVAMAIIGVLLGLAVFGVSAALTAQRNTERKAALQDISMGMRVYEDASGASPSRIFFDVSTAAAYVGGTNATTAACETSTTDPCVKVPLKGAAKPIASASIGNGVGDALTGKTSSTATKYAFTASCTGGYYLALCVENSVTPFEVGTCASASKVDCK
jgi:prepilin-type N-terminal cleavage/methylation domain-containing protein